MPDAPRAHLDGSDAPPVVSVIVAAYNAADYIEATCLSAIRQTYRALEIIVVDDGSTDETAAIVERLAASDDRVRLIRQQNAGVAAARNTGIAAASGAFIAPLDADDLWDPTKIERQVQRLQEAGPTAGMAYCWWAWIDTHNRVLDRSPRWRAEGHVLAELVEINFTGNASVPLFRRAFVEAAGGYDATLRARAAQGCEDWDLAIRVAERGSVVTVPAVLVAYRRRTDGMSTACDTMWRSRTQVMDALAARQPSLPRSALDRSHGQFALYLAGVAFWSGQYRDAVRWGLRARPFSLVARILPHVATMIARRVLRRGAAPHVLSPGSSMTDESRLPNALIPYDRVYARYWRKRS